MCNPVNALLGKPKKDNSAAEAAERRRLAIAQGTRSIDSAFSGFDDSFFDNRAQSFVDFASPQLDDQFSDAREKLIFALTRSGNLKSLAGVEGLADLEGEKERAAQGFASEGLNLAQNARNDVESARADLTSQLLASENPGAAAESASRRAGILTQQPSFAPIANIFQNVTAGLGAAASNPSTDFKGLSPTLFSRPASGTQRVVA
jgi:hypothetical protein